MSNSKKITITTETDVWDCECCGSVYDSTLTIHVEKEDGSDDSFTVFNDGHFGSGFWSGEEDTKWYFVLAAVYGFSSIAIKTESYTNFIGDTEDESIQLELLSDCIKLTVNGTLHVLTFTDDEYKKIEEDNLEYDYGYTFVDEEIYIDAIRRFITMLGYEIEELNECRVEESYSYDE